MKDIKPNYYRRTINGVEIDVTDIADAFDLGYHAQNAIKYLVRAGRKDEKSLVDDLIKARHYIDRLTKKHEDAERLALYEQIEDRDQETNPETITCPKGDPACCGQIHDACAPGYLVPVEPTTTQAILDEIKRTPVMLVADPEPPKVEAVARPCWIFQRGSPREYNIKGPFPTREDARRALDPARVDERIVMADDPYQVPADVVERLYL